MLRKFDQVDRIVANGHEITDQKVIDGLRDIYRTAKWRPFLDTSPSDQISIRLYSGGEPVLQFTYGAGWLMDESRKGILSPAQREWMDTHIRSKIPKENLPEANFL